MTAAEVETKMEANCIPLTPDALKQSGSAPQIFLTESTPNTYRRLLSVPNSPLQVSAKDKPSSSMKVISDAEQDAFMNMISNSQRGRMDEQRCSFEPSKSASSTPTHTKRRPREPVSLTGADSEKFFSLLANTQGSRLDDQRMTLPALPGIQNEKQNSSDGADSSYLCYMVSKVQGSRMEEQRCSLPQLLSPELQPSTPRDNSESAAGPPRSASFSSSAEIEQPKLSEADQDKFLTLMYHAQRGRIDEQRCVLDPGRGANSTPKHNENMANGADSEKFFSLLANTQGKRLDDQRVSLPTLPGTRNGGTNSANEGKDASYLCYMVSKVQGSTMDEQRCSAPHILQNLGSPAVQRKTQSGSAGLRPTAAADKPQRSFSLTGTERKMSVADQDSFLDIMHQVQRGRIDEQRCSLGPSSLSLNMLQGKQRSGRTIPTGPEADAFFGVLAKSQARRLDDQRVSLSTLPGIGGTPERKKNGGCAKAEVQGYTPHTILAEGLPVTPRKANSRPTSPAVCAQPGPPNVLPKSATFSPDSEHQTMLNSQAQVTVRLSMTFTTHQGHKFEDQPCTYPEVFLTVGAPGERIVVPLSPSPGRQLSLNLNLVPKEDGKSKLCSPNHTGPRSRPSSPNPEPCNTPRLLPACSHQGDHGKPTGNLISPAEDCFNLIERVHTAQLQRGMEQEDPGKARGRAEQEKGQCKGAGRKDKKDCGRRR